MCPTAPRLIRVPWCAFVVYPQSQLSGVKFWPGVYFD